MSYHGLPNWPPVWTWVEGTENKRPNGEVGVLKQVRTSSIEPVNRIFLYIEHEKEAVCCLITRLSACRSQTYCKIGVSAPSAKLETWISRSRFKFSILGHTAPYFQRIFHRQTL
jgi:hypothetical protein